MGRAFYPLARQDDVLTYCSEDIVRFGSESTTIFRVEEWTHWQHQSWLKDRGEDEAVYRGHNLDMLSTHSTIFSVQWSPSRNFEALEYKYNTEKHGAYKFWEWNISSILWLIAFIFGLSLWITSLSDWTPRYYNYCPWIIASWSNNCLIMTYLAWLQEETPWHIRTFHSKANSNYELRRKFGIREKGVILLNKLCWIQNI